MKQISTALICAALTLVIGCKSVGPRTIPRDRFDYSGALAESWKNQMLLNLVKTRYLDVPIYLDVGQIVSGYTWETGANINGEIARNGAGDTFLGVGGYGRFTDRPTITYTPMIGEKFLESYLTPINPVKVMSLIQAGYSADFVLELTVDSLNGLRNWPSRLASRQKADPEFFQVLRLLHDIQDAGGIGLRMEGPTNGLPKVLFFFREDRTEPGVAGKAAEVKQLLGIREGETLFRLVQSPVRAEVGELAIATRSLSQLMEVLSRGVEIPPTHVQRRLLPPTPAAVAEEQPLLHIHSGPDKPDGVFVGVPYEGQWFWIANDDWKSKRTFSSILFLFTLANAGTVQQLPTLTIPAQ